MVEVTVLFEGGADPKEKANVETMDNSDRLRIAFSQLLNAGLENPNVKIVTAPLYSNRNVRTVVANWNEGDYLLIDLDGPQAKRAERIQESGLTSIEDSVFFMVQAMEAWILSQPEAIDQTFASIRKKDSSVTEDDSIVGKNPEAIFHPDRILQAVLARHFESIKGGKPKKLVYGKLRHAPDLLLSLDIHKLKTTFTDVRLLLEKIVQ